MKTELVRLAGLASALFTLSSCSSMVGPREQMVDDESFTLVTDFNTGFEG